MKCYFPNCSNEVLKAGYCSFHKLEANKKYYSTPRGRENRRLGSQRYQKKKRESVILALGGRCVKCGFSDPRALQIDHIGGGGSTERGKNNKNWAKIYRDVLGTESRSKYQLLCANCNWIKRSEENECRK